MHIFLSSFFNVFSERALFFVIYRAPFDVSMSVLAIMILVIVFAWTENYGDQNTDLSQSLNNAFISIRTGR